MNNRLISIFVVLGVFTGVLTTSQLISSVPPSNSFPLDQIQSQEKLLAELKGDQLSLQSRIVVLREQIQEINEKNGLSQQQGILDKLNQLKEKVGLTVINSPGIEISLADGFSGDRNTEDNISQFLVHAADIRDIVNVARAADAKGIAINNQRILATTSVISVGNSVLINNVNVAPPFTVSVAGNVEQIVRQIQDPQILVDLKKRVGEGKVRMTIQEKPYVSIPIYNGSFRTKYLKNE